MTTLIQVKERTVLDLPSLFRQVIKSIYVLETMTSMEFDQMMYSLEGWTKHHKMKKEIGLNTADVESMVAVKDMLLMLKSNNEGKFDKRKAMFKEKGVDYLKFHRCPEAYKPKDFYNAEQERLKLPKEEQ